MNTEPMEFWESFFISRFHLNIWTNQYKSEHAKISRHTEVLRIKEVKAEYGFLIELLIIFIYSVI